ncbi:MAG: cytochrome C oxidase subunit IV family protein [Candidatus Eiseniibacteriota bacterium]
MSDHVISPRIYLTIFAALLVLTTTTVVVAFMDLGAFNNVAALSIAVAKAVLVILFFMHVRYSTPLTWLTVAGGFFWLAILLVLTYSDYISRGWLGVPGK